MTQSFLLLLIFSGCIYKLTCKESLCVRYKFFHSVVKDVKSAVSVYGDVRLAVGEAVEFKYRFFRMLRIGSGHKSERQKEIFVGHYLCFRFCVYHVRVGDGRIEQGFVEASEKIGAVTQYGLRSVARYYLDLVSCYVYAAAVGTGNASV